MATTEKTRPVTKWIVRLASLIQREKEIELSRMALFEEDQVSLDLTEVEQEAYAKAVEKARKYFLGLPQEILNDHGVNQDEDDFEKLLEMNKGLVYMDLDDKQLAQFKW